MQYSQEHLKTMVYAEFGGQTECIMGNSKIENANSHSFFIWGVLGLWKQYFPFPNTEILLISEQWIIRWVVFNQLFDLRFLFVRYYPVVPFAHSNIS